jgi:hypothetical protein
VFVPVCPPISPSNTTDKRSWAKRQHGRDDIHIKFKLKNLNKRPFGRLRRKWEHSVRRHVREIGFELD